MKAQALNGHQRASLVDDGMVCSALKDAANTKALRDGDGNVVAGVGGEVTLIGSEHSGLYVEDEYNFYSVVQQPSSPYLTSYYVEDENNVGSVRRVGTQYNADTNLYVRSNGVDCYETESVSVKTQGSAYTSNKLYISTGGVYRELTQTLYTEGSTRTYYNRSNGARRYTTTLVEVPLYTDGGVQTYPMYTRRSKTLYEAGSSVTFPAYKKYSGKVYDAGKTVHIEPAEVETQSVTALTV